MTDLNDTESKSCKTIEIGQVVDNVQIDEKNLEKSGLDKYAAGEHIESENLFVTKYGQISKSKEIIGSAFYRRFSKGQILYVTRRAYLRKASIATFDGICSNTTLVLEANKNGLDPNLLPFILQSEKFVNYAVKNSVGSTNPYVRWRELAKFEIILHPTEIQKRISNVLWGVENSSQTTESLLQKTIILKKVTMNQLLTKGIGHTKFKKVKWYFGKEIDIPLEWEENNLFKLKINTSSGGTPNRSVDIYYGGEISWIKSGELKDNFIANSDKKITKEGLDNSSAKIFPVNTVLIAMYGATIGKTGILKDNASTNQAVCAILPNSTFDPYFLQQYLISKRNIIVSFGMGAGQPNISQELIQNFSYLIPPLPEQEKIASILQNIDQQIAKLKEHLIHSKQLRKNLTSALLYNQQPFAEVN